MTLNELQSDRSDRKSRKRVGRGIGSGTGKTCGSGHKGQKSRSGVSINGFEGGQMPIYRRVPKRGFTNPNRRIFQLVNLGKLQELVDNKKLSSSKEITVDTLVQLGIVTIGKSVKILGKGELKASLNIVVDAASKSAVSAIEKAGGSVKLPS